MIFLMRPSAALNVLFLIELILYGMVLKKTHIKNASGESAGACDGEGWKI